MVAECEVVIIMKTVDQIVASLRGVGADLNEAFFTEVRDKLCDESFGLNYTMAERHRIVMMVCHAWLHSNGLLRLPAHVDLWPLIAAITPVAMRDSTQEFWRMVQQHAQENSA